jgi:hypothetical protein
MHTRGVAQNPVKRGEEILFREARGSVLIPLAFLEKINTSDVTLFCGARISLWEDDLPGKRQLAQELLQRGDLGDATGIPFPQLPRIMNCSESEKALSP